MSYQNIKKVYINIGKPTTHKVQIIHYLSERLLVRPCLLL